MKTEALSNHPLTSGLVIQASREELKAGVVPCVHHVGSSPDLVMAACRAIFESKGENASD